MNIQYVAFGVIWKIKHVCDYPKMNLNEIRMADVYGIQIEIHQYTSNVAFTGQS